MEWIAERPVAEALDQFRNDVLSGLAQEQKNIPSKYFYDERGSQLFEDITRTEEYYPTDVEEDIMKRYVHNMVDHIGRNALLVELGSGSSIKTRIILDAIVDPAGYVPIDISAEHLDKTAEQLRQRYPDMPVLPVAADYTQEIVLPLDEVQYERIVVFYPGSTIGNFDPDRAVDFLSGVRELVGDSGAILIGVDLVKDRAVLEAAYNDKAGVTAEFNLNLLNRINSELGADFDVDKFSHRAVYNEELSRIEMHIVSDVDQQVSVAGTVFSFSKGEYIYTESSYKYTLESFASLMRRAGFHEAHSWVDPRDYFSIHFLEASVN